ncbi:VLRF1 family aeRF1-type release factor [Deinococcus aestuarii]|uniref:VLRF1 family aeRF1-type release factor n=1 Tax=Deinococcus aestuarii TaxID=2774531 RepID=UPI001C0B7442|nr:VLRF1 family aeRF1-type release factor [Deinococcus aestuarii]
MIYPSELARLQSLPEDQSVLMAVVHVNPASQDNHGDALTTRVKSALNDLGVPPTLGQRLLDDVARAREARGKSAVYVLGEGIDERFDVQLDLPERFHFGRPLPALVQAVTEAYPPVGVLAVDRDWARMFILKQGELTELRREQNTELQDVDRDDLTASTTAVPGAQGAARAQDGSGFSAQGTGPRSDSGVELFRRHLDALQQRFYNETAQELARLMKDHDLNHLILVGPVARLAEFRAEIPDTASFEVVGETNVEVGTGSAPEQMLLGRLIPLLEEFAQTEQVRLMEQLQEQGVMEMERVLEMVQQGRVYLLVIPEDGSQVNLFRSHNREVPYFTARKDAQESPLDGSPMERVTLEEMLPQLQALYGLEVRRVYGEHAEKLVREYGGLAGLTRY